MLVVVWCVISYVCHHQWVNDVLRIILVGGSRWASDRWKRWSLMKMTSIVIWIFILYYCVAVYIARLVIFVSIWTKFKLLLVLIASELSITHLGLILHLTCAFRVCNSHGFYAQLIMVKVLHHCWSVVWIGSTVHLTGTNVFLQWIIILSAYANTGTIKAACIVFGVCILLVWLDIDWIAYLAIIGLVLELKWRSNLRILQIFGFAIIVSRYLVVGV